MDLSRKNEPSETQSKSFGDAICSLIIEDGRVEQHRVPNSTLTCVRAGEMEVTYSGKRQRVKAGQYVFLPKNPQIRVIRNAKEDSPYLEVSITFTRAFLATSLEDCRERFSIAVRKDSGRIPILVFGDDIALFGLFSSLLPFVDKGLEPSEEVVTLKQREALHILLSKEPRLLPVLFDFHSQWRPDLETFMRTNFREHLSAEEFAYYSGRSLATFKRDFAKFTVLPPRAWTIKMRSHEAARLIAYEKVCPGEAAFRAGFTNRSHFVRVFHTEFGLTPSQFRRREEGRTVSTMIKNTKKE